MNEIRRGCGFWFVVILALVAYVLVSTAPALSAASQTITLPVQGIGMFVRLLLGG
jgi:hypothetical protein